tara:strand:- start:1093 stop:1236 length:144 start_codon:yes stop_codon:yes gene_type:complete
MKRKDYIYCTIIGFILVGSYLTIGKIIAEQDANCWDVIQEISESEGI